MTGEPGESRHDYASESNGGGDSTASGDAEVFAREAERPAPGFLAEFGHFLVHNKKWWLTPIIVLILLAGLLVILAGTVGPFIYPGLQIDYPGLQIDYPGPQIDYPGPQIDYPGPQIDPGLQDEQRIG